MVEGMPDGLDTRLGERGREVSTGQAQRIAIARALVDPSRDVWLLDEPGSNLDRWTEEELKRSVIEASAGKTLVVATHRLHWLDDMDEVIDLDGSPKAECDMEGGNSDGTGHEDPLDSEGARHATR